MSIHNNYAKSFLRTAGIKRVGEGNVGEYTDTELNREGVKHLANVAVASAISAAAVVGLAKEAGPAIDNMLRTPTHADQVHETEQVAQHNSGLPRPTDINVPVVESSK